MNSEQDGWKIGVAVAALAFGLVGWLAYSSGKKEDAPKPKVAPAKVVAEKPAFQ